LKQNTIEVLNSIWCRVLQQPSIGTDDNFFDLGGDSALALEVFNEIARVCGREMPPVTIYQAPTIAALANLLEQPNTPKFPPLVLLKSGTDQPPIFLAHGLGGTAMDFYQIVKHIRTERPIYGMQARGIDGADAPFDRIEDMAQFHLDAIREIQPHGPYLLIGYSLGGLVALEMAQRLLKKRESVGLLAMIDAYPNSRYLSVGEKVSLIARQTSRRVSSMVRSTKNGARDLYQPPAGTLATPAMQRTRESAYEALTRYRPSYYRAKIHFVRAAVLTGFPADAAAVWNPLASAVDVETVAGDHLGIITTYYQDLASVLSGWLRTVHSR
jgi:acetoacetyl-CoA synthetase